MTDLDPKIWDNPTLGSASTLPYLDEVEAEITENHLAKVEKRRPRTIEHLPRFTDETTNLTKYVVDGEVVDPAKPSDNLAYFHVSNLRTKKEKEREKKEEKVPSQASKTGPLKEEEDDNKPVSTVGKAPTAKAAASK